MFIALLTNRRPLDVPRVRNAHPGAALAALAAGGFTLGTSEFVSMGLLPEIASGVHVSIPTAGHVISAYALGVLIGAPILAALGARLPRKPLLVALMLAFAIGNVASAVAPSYGALVGARFVSGLPHGAYFGIAALVAADLAAPGRRARAVARVLLGLSIANVVGVPAATWLGQAAGWRSAYFVVGILAASTAVAVARTVPATPADADATVRRELGALGRPQVWLTLATGAIGGGGLFAIYTYISPILTQRAGLPEGIVPVALSVWGLGMVAGSLLGGHLVDRRPLAATFGIFGAMAAFFAVFALTSTSPITAIATVFLLGMGLALPTALQVRLMDVAGDAQTLAAALNHASFNAANALGASLGGLALASPLGLAGPMWVAAGLSTAGAAALAISAGLERVGGGSRIGQPA